MSEQKKVRIECKGSGLIDIDNIQAFQGDLKDLSTSSYEKLKKVIMELGYSEPISVWMDSKKKFFCLNGHQRLRVLKGMREEGFLVPKIPVNLVEAKDIREAKKKVLSLTSQFGEITEDGLHSFMVESNLDIDWVQEHLRLPEISFDHFKANFYEIEGQSSSGGAGGEVQIPPGTHICPNCGFSFDETKGGTK